MILSSACQPSRADQPGLAGNCGETAVSYTLPRDTIGSEQSSLFIAAETTLSCVADLRPPDGFDDVLSEWKAPVTHRDFEDVRQDRDLAQSRRRPNLGQTLIANPSDVGRRNADKRPVSKIMTEQHVDPLALLDEASLGWRHFVLVAAEQIGERGARGSSYRAPSRTCRLVLRDRAPNAQPRT